jgi:peptide/nickel transport system ATP-binding protein
MQNVLFQIKDLSVNFGTINVVDDISLSVNKGEMLAIVGESGSGKSVTAMSVLRLLPSNAKINGCIYFNINEEKINVQAVAPEAMKNIRGNEIAMIFQEPMTSLNPVMPCGVQVSEALLTHNAMSKKEAKQKTLELFEQVKLPNPAQIYRRYPHELSGGQKQRVMIAMAMICTPSLLICDEPTTALDVLVQQDILLLIKQLQQKNKMSVIFISHDLNVVAKIADKIAVMFKGKIVEQGNTNDIFTTPKHAYTKALLACRPVLYSKGVRLPVVGDFIPVENHSSHETLKSVNFNAEKGTPQVLLNPSSEKGKNILLSVKNICVWYPVNKNFFGKTNNYVKAVDDVSFHLKYGETLGLVGGSGCGKTTLGRAILRLIEPTGGEIVFDNIDILKLNPEALRKLRTKMQLVFQDPYASLNPSKTIGEAIAEPLTVHNIYPKNEIKEVVRDWLEKVNLKAGFYTRYPHEFSGGQRQRVVIARALAMKPSFVIFDESVSALDVSVQAQVLNLLNDLKAELGFASIFISHDLSVVKYLSDKIMVMNKGKIEETGNAEDVYYAPQSAYTKELLAAVR